MIENSDPKKIQGFKTKKDFTIFQSQVLGKGSFGKVYKGVDSSGKEVAIKELLKGKEKHMYIESLIASTMNSLPIQKKTEADALAMFNHPNIIQLIDTARHEDTFYIILELCEGNLRQLMEQKHGKWKEKEFLEVLLDIAHGLYFIHAKNCMHRDLKPANILIKKGRCKIADLGLISQKTKTKKKAGTEKYMAPEVANESYGKEIDIYSLGVICFEIIGDNKFSQEIVELCKQMMSEVPEKRPSIQYIVLKLKQFLTRDKAEQLYLQDQIDKLLKEGNRKKEPSTQLKHGEVSANSVSENSSSSSSQMQCFKCNGYGHYANECPINGGYKNTATCYKCGKVGHYANQCSNEEIGNDFRCYKCKKIGHYAKECKS